MTRVSAVVLATTNRGERVGRIIALAAQYRGMLGTRYIIFAT